MDTEPFTTEKTSGKFNFDSVNSTKMLIAKLSKRQIVGIVIAMIVLFVLGFVIGWFSAPDDSSAQTFDMKYVVRKRKEQMKRKNDFHEKMFGILDAENIGENLR